VSIKSVALQANKAASWKKSKLKILLNIDNENWASTGLNLSNIAGMAVNQWRRSIDEFSEIHSTYSFLKNLGFIIYLKGVNDTSLLGEPDIEIKFTEDLLSSLIGETKLIITFNNFISYAEINIELKDLNATGVYNILTHEFGHALGLEHSNIEFDLMYSEREKKMVSEELLCPSTLDIYALALIYQWIEIGLFRPYNLDTVTLPVQIEYDVLACNKV
jgi:hypothetical protein